MTDVARVLSEVDALEHVQADLAAVAMRTDRERRYELVQLRKQLSTQIMLVGQSASPLFDDDPDMRVAFRRHYSAMRSATALHQAEWPAVRLGEFDDQHRQSAAGVRDANGAFVAWMRATLAPGS